LELDTDHLESILTRYDTAGPRYTSYPTAPVWNEDYGSDDYRAGLRSVDPEAGLSVYAHVPFCSSLCHFCACNRVITHKPELPERYLEVIEREIANVRELLPGSPTASQLHWGGGTPTHLTPDQIKRLFDALTDAIPPRKDAEISIEVDPRVTTPEQVEMLRACGFNRISLGVQDFDEKVQESVHRIQPPDMTSSLVKLAREAGFLSVNLDLIYGLPFQTESSFERTLDTVMEISPDRLALYSYAHVTWVAKQQRGFERKDLPDARRKLRIMVLAIRRFLESGYEYVGMDHFAKPDDELVQALRDGTLRRNFMGYTTQAGVELLGFGCSSISELRDSYAQNQRDLEAWDQAVMSDGLATLRGHALSDEDRERRWVITRIMCHGALDSSLYREKFGEDFAERYGPELESLAPLEADGLISMEGDGSLRATPVGRVLIRNVAMVFDGYLRAQQATGKRLFSKTV
jgi:oxygen-independent coproporphyrinogen-3 oxidase